MIDQEIARLTGKLEWKVDNRPLLAFQNRLAKVHQSLSEFSALANKKFGIKVTLDSKTLRAELERAANTRINFKNFHVDQLALDMVQARIKESLDKTRINLKNVRVNMSETLAQRAALRKQLEGVSVGIRVAMRFQEANTALREWKKVTEQRFKLHINADISQSKLYRNAANTLRMVGARLGTFTIKSPKIQLSVDRQHLRAEIAAVLEQIKREVRIKIDLNSMTSGSGGGGSRRGGMGRAAAGGAMAGGLMGEGMGLARGFVPGLGAAYAVGQMNRINQEVGAVGTSLKAVSGSNEEFTSNMDFLSKMADEQGRNIRDIGPQFVSVLASAKASIGSKGTQDLFRGLMKYGTVMGLDGEAMKGSMRAISQMFSKDKIQAEEAQGQLAERLPAAMQLLAQANGTDVPGLRAKMQAGQLDPKKVLPEMARIMEKLATDNGAYAAALESTRVQQGRMNREFEKSVVIFSGAGFDRGLAGFFNTMTEGMKDAEPLIKALGQAFSILIQPVNAVINIIGNLGSMFDKMANGLGISSKALALLPLIFFPVISTLGLLALAIEDVMVYSQGGKSLFGDWIEQTPGAKKAIDEVRASWEQLSATFEKMFSGSQSKVSIDTGVLSSERLKNNFAAINFSDMFIQTLHEVKSVMDLVNATIERMQGAASYARRITRDGAGEVETSLNLVKGLSMNDAERKADIDRQIKLGYVDPLGPEDIQARNDAQARRTQVLPGLNTPLSNDPNRTGVGSVPSAQAPVISNTWSPGAVQIIIQPEKEGIFTEEGIANKTKEVLRNLLNQHEIPQDTE